MGRARYYYSYVVKANKIVKGVLRDARRSILSKFHTFHAKPVKRIFIAGHKEKATFPAPIFTKLTNFQ